MNSLLSSKRMLARIIGRGVPPTYASRVVRELSDHREDLIEAGDEQSGAALGEERHLAREIVAGYRQRTFAGRHPWLVFTLLPLPLMVLSIPAILYGVMLAYSGVALLVMQLTEFEPEAAPAMNFGFLVPAHVAMMVLPSLLCTGLVCRLARRAGLRPSRAALACVPILVMSFLFCQSFGIDPNQDVLRFGLGLWVSLGPIFGPAFGPTESFGPLSPLDWRQFAQLAVPVLVLIRYVARDVHQRRMVLR